MADTDPMTIVDLDAVRARNDAFETAWDHEFCSPEGPSLAARSAEDVPALLGLLDKCAAALNVAIAAADGSLAVTADELDGCRIVLGAVAR